MIVSKSLSSPSLVDFPHPFSHLLDISVIVGDDMKLKKLATGLESEIIKDDFTQWKKLIWFKEEW